MHKFKSIYEIIQPHNCAIILYQFTPSYGHWITLNVVSNEEHEGTPLLEMFDAYGKPPEYTLSKIEEPWRTESNQNHTYLLKLIDETWPHDFSYNEFNFQKLKTKSGKNIVSCGRHAVVRAMLKELNLYEYQELFTTLHSDDLVTLLTADESQVK